MSAIVIPAWISQKVSDGEGFVNVSISVSWNTGISTGSSVVAWMPRTNYKPQDIYGSNYANWQFSDGWLYWSDLSNPKYNVCDGKSLIYKEWSSVYGLCNGNAFVSPFELPIISALSVIVLIFCFFSLFYGIASPCTSTRHGYAIVSSVFSILAFITSVGVVCYITAIPYFRYHVYRPFSTTPVLLLSPDSLQEQILPFTASMDFGFSFYALCFVTVLEFLSSLLTWGTSAVLKKKRESRKSDLRPPPLPVQYPPKFNSYNAYPTRIPEANIEQLQQNQLGRSSGIPNPKANHDNNIPAAELSPRFKIEEHGISKPHASTTSYINSNSESHEKQPKYTLETLPDFSGQRNEELDNV